MTDPEKKHNRVERALELAFTVLALLAIGTTIYFFMTGDLYSSWRGR